MTSANVIEYTIFDKNNKEVGSHRQNVMCSICNDKLQEFTPPENYTIKPWGYDEDEEMWENHPVNLKTWLENHKAEVTFKKFNVGDTVVLKKKRGKGIILELKKVTFFQDYLVKLENGEEIIICQTQIKP